MNCPKCGAEMKHIPAGVSKRTNKPYDAFDTCEACNQAKKQGVPFVSQGEIRKADTEIAEGKVRHGFAIEAFKMGKELNVTTATEINKWVSYVMTGKLSQPEVNTAEEFNQTYPE